ncbi:uncharacterized protein [Diadema antillarum]|uniref:uncharacterized protein isoform X2 n=1 Tax=Diadema antillarum TaxID=105358 RepID=UPI003A87FDAE
MRIGSVMEDGKTDKLVAETITKQKSLWNASFSHGREPNPDAKRSVAQWWEYIEKNYCESQRYYHTLQHVDAMIRLLHKHYTKFPCSPPFACRAVEVAIFFHDLIYNPKAGDNEEQSAEAFMQFAKDHLTDDEDFSQDCIDTIYDWILATKHHCTPEHNENFGTGAKHFFLDLDLEVLGRPPAEYEIYANQIRKEYSHIPDVDFRVGRAKVLKKFLERNRIFATELFYKTYESQARQNIQDEIRKLLGSG